jgi:hypothetical protein
VRFALCLGLQPLGVRAEHFNDRDAVGDVCRFHYPIGLSVKT